MAKRRFQPGQMDRRVRIMRKQQTRTASGDVQYSWTSLGDFWASVDYRTGNEAEESESIYSHTQVTYVMRYNTQIMVEDRLVDLDNRTRRDIYDIRAILDEGRRHTMRLIAERYQAEGSVDDMNSFDDPAFSDAFN